MILVVLIAAAILVGQPSGAAPGGTDPKLLQRLEAIDAKAAKLAGLSADFEQEKHSTLLRQPLISKGRVRVSGETTRWDTTSPTPSIVVTNPRELRIFDPQARTLEVYPMDRELAQLASSPIPRLEHIREHFEIRALDPRELDQQADPNTVLALRLSPTTKALREHVQEVRVLIDQGTGVARRVEIRDAEGDRTIIRFHNARSQPDLAEKELEFVLPPGTKVSRPLGGEPEKGPPPEKGP